MSTNLTVLAVIIAVLLIIVTIAVLAFQKYQTTIATLREREKEMDRRMYELSILKELGERIGYSLDVQQIVDIITGSLHQFIEYSVASYMILEPEKILFKVHLEQSVSRKFIDEVKVRMLNSLTALLDRQFDEELIDEVLSGAILDESSPAPVKSYFNIPLVIGDHVVGVLTVAHKQSGLYQDEEMTILYKITQQASQAVTRLEEVVQTEQHKLNSMVQSMTEGIIMTDTEYRILVINPIVRKALALENVTDVTMFDLMEKVESVFHLKEKLTESIKLEKTVIVPEVFINDTYFKVVFAPVRSNSGKSHQEILGGVVIFHDITHDKELERMRDDFTAMMVHELRSPLGNIRRLSEYLQKEATDVDEETNEKYLGLIYRNASEMLGLVNDLLDVAKIESGKFVVQKELSNIREVIAESVTFFNQTANEKRINLSAFVADDVPSETMFDSQRVSQMVNNYLSNAIKFTPENGSVEIQVLLHSQDSLIEDEAKVAHLDWRITNVQLPANTPDSLIVAVTDTGDGIPEDKVEQLFSKFKQMDAFVNATGEKGTGLGLSIVKGIAEAHGGFAGVATEKTKGSTFFFTLPLAAGH